MTLAFSHVATSDKHDKKVLTCLNFAKSIFRRLDVLRMQKAFDHLLNANSSKHESNNNNIKFD